MREPRTTVPPGRARQLEHRALDNLEPVPHLHNYDEVIVNSSGGKDSLVTKAAIRRLAVAQGYPLHRVVVQYNRLGDRVTWPGTADIGPNAPQLLAAYGDQPGTEQLVTQQCDRLGLTLFVTSNPTPGDLLDRIAERGRFPDGGRRFCTSAEKRQPGQKFITARYQRLALDRPARLLYVFGFRAAESAARAKKTPFVANANVNSRRTVDEWYPIHHYTDEQVWQTIHTEQLPYHWVYRAGMRRLSCSFCVLAGLDDLVLAAALRPDVAAEYLAIEQANIARGRASGDLKGRTFQSHRTMAQIIDAARHHPIVTELGLQVPQTCPPTTTRSSSSARRLLGLTARRR
ncbi:phosphoadenosine phosphosulfate reductase family protein [Actinoplanes sp. NPDC051859]|uniref:phosphoadenosine phosphosulfate reductase domain-containing protein n=1 Tax=Actinoplanes sp. NPDC051859 TaxID=3363909 RepID=UPI0037A6F567